MSKTPEDMAMEKAKIQLMYLPDTIFYTTILFSLKQEWGSQIETAATNGVKFKVNPIWFTDLTEEKRIGLLTHELLHVALNHMSRLGDRHPKVWNLAADHVINLTLKAAGYELPDGGCWDERFIGMSTEQVYEIIYEEVEQDEADGGPGADDLLVPGGDDIEYPGGAEEAQVIEKEVAGIINQAKMLAEGSSSMPGNLPGEMEIELQKILNPKLPWYTILQNHMSGFAKDDYTWAKPKRRYMPEFYLPSAYSEAIGEIATAFDISGSVSPDEISVHIGETSSLMEMLKPEKITVISFDHIIQNIQTLTENSDIYSEMKLVGGGGTNILPVLEWAIENNPEVMLIFTDGDFEMPDEEFHPTCPVIWLIHDNTWFKAPFGEIIYYNIGE